MNFLFGQPRPLNAIPTALLAASFRQALAAVNVLRRVWHASVGHQLTYCPTVIYGSDQQTYGGHCGFPFSC
jgi:hypothetical protein